MSSNESKLGEVDENFVKTMKEYWGSFEPSIESMFQSQDAKQFAEAEKKEILSFLPPYQNCDVLELAAGIGRFTGTIGERARSVTAVDFTESFIEENERANGHLKNITFKCADVRELDYPDNSFELIFSNWILTYLTDSEAWSFLMNIFRWLKPNGHFFFRESLWHSSGNFNIKTNPCLYRDPATYISMVKRLTEENINHDVKFFKNLRSFAQFRGKSHQLCVLIQKTQDKSEKRIRARGLYPKTDAPEVSLVQLPEGRDLVDDLCNKTGMKEDQDALVIQYGRGTIIKHLVQKYKVFFHGVDFSSSNFCYALTNQKELKFDHRSRIQYEATNWKQKEFSKDAYDAILCFDLLQSKEEAMALMRIAKGAVKGKGKLSWLLLIARELTDAADFFTEEELKENLESGGFSHFASSELEERKDLALQLLTNAFSSFINQEDSCSRDIQNALQEKIHLLKRNKIFLTSVTATK